MQEITKAMEELASNVAGMYGVIGQSLHNALYPIFTAMGTLGQSISDAMWEEYRAAGMPYGETHEGMMRWMEGLSKINHAQQEIEQKREENL